MPKRQKEKSINLTSTATYPFFPPRVHASYDFDRFRNRNFQTPVVYFKQIPLDRSASFFQLSKIRRFFVRFVPYE